MSDQPAGWQIILTRQPEKVLRRVPKELLQRIDAQFTILANNPRPAGSKKLSGFDNLYRIRVGDWRISYAIEEKRLVILVLEIAPRGNAYRNL
jgi:mRNA interferase RelE/StbE